MATENTLFATPEASIGLHLDPGGSYYLQHIQYGSAMGRYLALTSASLRGRDVVHIGIATHYVLSNCVDEMMMELQKADLETSDDIDLAIRRFESVASTNNASFPSQAQLQVIE